MTTDQVPDLFQARAVGAQSVAVNERRKQMGIFSKIRDSIFGKKEEEVHAAAAPPIQAEAAQPVSAPAPMSEVDVEARLTFMAANAGQQLNWRTSIVDLMKLLGMESSLAERRELAQELGYTGDTNDTATMNIWLHKQVMRKLAESGGIVPADLLD